MSLSKAAYSRVIKALHDGTIEPGGVYTQSEICKILDVSVTPLQHALRILENEGFVTIRARSGISIHRPSLKLYRECHQLRQILELAAMPYYVESSTDEEIQALIKRIEHHSTTPISQTPYDDIVTEQQAIERQLHRSIIGAMRSDTIDRIYNTNWERTNVIRQWPGRLTPEYISKTAAEHMAVLEAVKNRDSVAAIAALRQHLLLSLERGIMTNLYSDAP